jgi:hypothetical protein
MEGIRSRLLERGLTPSAAALAAHPVRGNTDIKYNSGWRQWLAYAESNQSLLQGSASSPSSVDVCNFLADSFLRGLEHKTVQAYRTAISNTLRTMGEKPLDEDLITLVLRGIRQLRPPRPAYSEFWEVEPALAKLRDWGPNASLSRKQLLMKLIFLLRITCFLRSSDLERIDFFSLSVSPSYIKFLVFRPKEGDYKWVSVQPFQEDPLLCPYECLREYLRQTARFRGLVGRNGRLLLSVRDNGTPIGAERISNLTVEALNLLGVNTKVFGAHSTRGAGATHALRNGARADQVMNVGNWSNPKTFKRFYDRAILPSVTSFVLSGEN